MDTAEVSAVVVINTSTFFQVWLSLYELLSFLFLNLSPLFIWNIL